MNPGDIKSFKGRRADRDGKTIHVVLIERMTKTRWRTWAWAQETPEGKWFKGGCITVSEHMIDPSSKRPRKDTKQEYFDKGRKAWADILTSKKERSKKRRASVQERFERNQERGMNVLVKGQTYYWPDYKQGTFTGDIKNGKAKMQPRSLFGGRKRSVWILLDRLFEQRNGRHVRVQY